MTSPEAPATARPTLAVLVHEGFQDERLIDVEELCRSFAGFLQEPVVLARAAGEPLHATLSKLTGSDWSIDFVTPGVSKTASMSSADFVYKDDGTPDWSVMWTGFCELALYGGPPHRGEDTALGLVTEGEATSGFDAVREIRRGIYETTGLFAEPAGEPGWLAVTCHSRKMAAWLAASIILENVEAKFEDEVLYVPAHPSFTLKNQVKSVITVVAKTNHYWQAHIAAQQPA